MASTYSTNLALELIGTGDQSGAWGTTTNGNLGTLIEQAISGYVTQAVTTGASTAITIPNGATGVARNMFIELTGTGGTNTFLTVPANKKLYFIYNNSTGDVTVKVSGQTGVSVPTGKKMALVCNGTDVVNAISYVPSFGTDSFTITSLNATSGSITTLASADASATVLRSASATITALIVGNGTNISPSSLSVGYLKFDGSGYDGYVTLDGTAMYVGHNSGSRDLVFQTDETDRLRVKANGSVGLCNATASNTNIGSWGAGVTISAGPASVAALEWAMESTLAGYVSYSQTAGTLLAFNLYSYANIPLVLGTNNTARMRIENDGRVAIGGSAVAAVDVAVRGSGSDSSTYSFATYTAAGNATFYVRNDGLMMTGLQANSPYNATTGSAVNAHITSDGILARSTSSIKYKHEVADASHGLTDLLGLRSVVFKSKSTLDDQTRVYGGLIAEEVHAAGLTEFVAYNEEGEPEGIAYTHMVALCIKAIQDLTKTVDDLATEVAKLKLKN